MKKLMVLGLILSLMFGSALVFACGKDIPGRRESCKEQGKCQGLQKLPTTFSITGIIWM